MLSSVSKDSLNLEADASCPSQGAFRIEPDYEKEAAALPPSGPPSFDSSSWHEALSLVYVMPESMEDLVHRYETGRGLDSVELVTSVHLEEKLGEGEARVCYLAKEGAGDGHAREIVAKEFKPERVGQGTDLLAQSQKECEIQTVAAFLAELFEAEIRSQAPKGHPAANAQVSYSKARTIVFKDDQGQQKVLNVEKKLSGPFLKFNNTLGGKNEEAEEPLVQAFSHWTFDRSGGRLLVCDLQGTKRNHANFALTDPAIHSDFGGRGGPVPVFRSNDLGREGMRKFFESHKCQDECRRLKLGT